jgi:hypothetical protein
MSISPGKEPDMIRTLPLVAGLFAAALVWSSAALAAEEAEAPPPPFDWSDVVDDMEEGDHVVGEELCAAPR